MNISIIFFFCMHWQWLFCFVVLLCHLMRNVLPNHKNFAMTSCINHMTHWNLRCNACTSVMPVIRSSSSPVFAGLLFSWQVIHMILFVGFFVFLFSPKIHAFTTLKAWSVIKWYLLNFVSVYIYFCYCVLFSSLGSLCFL